MGRVTLTLPRLGETMEEARVTEWLVAPGDSFARGDVLLEVETDKTVVEVPALAAGTLRAHLVAPGDTVELDAPIAEVEQDGAPDASGEKNPAQATEKTRAPETGTARVSVPAHEPAPAATAKPDPANSSDAPPSALSPGRIAASPAARAKARHLRVSLDGATGTGRRGRVTAADITAPGGAGTATPGDPVTIVLLHGLFDDAAGWRGLPRQLARQGLRVVVPDLPGHGADDTPADGFDHAADLLAARLPDGPLHLVGHSLGAALAARLARRGDIRALTLFAPAGIGARINADFIDGMTGARTPAALARALALLEAGPLSPDLIADRLARHIAGHDARLSLVHAVAHGGIQQIDARPDIAAARCRSPWCSAPPTGSSTGATSQALPAETCIHLVPGAGHLPHLARPDLAAALIAQRPVQRPVAAQTA